MGQRTCDSRRYIERVITGDDRGILSWVLRLALLPWAALYSIGLTAYLWTYRAGIRRRTRLPAIVVSVGNLTFGGTGKTPAVIALARALVGSGKRVVILSRGHGGSADGPRVVSNGENLLADAREAGDEPVMIALSLPGVPVLVGRDRRVTGMMACERFSPDIIVLDDGMQYWQLHRDVEIAVVDAARQFGSGFVMPAGDLREPRRGLARAHFILLVGGSALRTLRAPNTPEQGTDVGEHFKVLPYSRLKETLGRLAPHAHIHDCARAIGGFVSSVGSTDERLPEKGEKVISFCGIGRPESFERALRDAHVDLLDSMVFPDHWSYSPEDLRRIEARRAELGAPTVVTTEKDLARIIPVIPNAVTNLGEIPPCGRDDDTGLSDSIKGLCALRAWLEVDRIGEIAEHIAHGSH